MIVRVPLRPEAFGALRACGAGLLVAAKRDRIARDVVVAATVEQMTREAGAKVVTADGVAVEDTPEEMLPRGLMDLFAQYERAVIRCRTRAAFAVIRSKGKGTPGGLRSAFASKTTGSWRTPGSATRWRASAT